MPSLGEARSYVSRVSNLQHRYQHLSQEVSRNTVTESTRTARRFQGSLNTREPHFITT